MRDLTSNDGRPENPFGPVGWWARLLPSSEIAASGRDPVATRFRSAAFDYRHPERYGCGDERSTPDPAAANVSGIHPGRERHARARALVRPAARLSTSLQTGEPGPPCSLRLR